MNNAFKTKTIIAVLTIGAMTAGLPESSWMEHTDSLSVKLLNPELLDQNGAQVSDSPVMSLATGSWHSISFIPIAVPRVL